MFKTQDIIWEVPLAEVQVGIAIGYEVELSRNSNFQQINYTLSTFREDAVQGVFFYSLDSGVTWVDFPIGGGQVFNTSYMMKVVVNIGEATSIYAEKYGTIYKVSADGSEILDTYTIGSFNSTGFSTDRNNNLYISGQNKTVYKISADGALKDNKSINIRSNPLAVVVDSGRDFLWQIERRNIYLKNLRGSAISSVVLPFEIDVDDYSSSSSSSFSSSSVSSESSESSLSSSSISSESSASSSSVSSESSLSSSSISSESSLSSSSISSESSESSLSSSSVSSESSYSSSSVSSESSASSSSISSESSLSSSSHSSSSSSSYLPQEFTFTITTTGSPQNFTLPLTNNGTFNCTVDWGDTSTSTITAYDDADRIHSYTAAGTYTVKIDGNCQGFQFNNGGDKTLINTVVSWGRTCNFLRLDFYGCSNLTSLPSSPEERGRLKQVTNFANFCNGCSSLTSIPSGIFDYNTTVTSFNVSFTYCTSLTSIPSGLFDHNTGAKYFYYAFASCTSLASIPSGLFDNNINTEDFEGCFHTCTSLTSIPANLFDYNVKVTNFQETFYATSITSIPSGLFDNCTLVTDFSYCFYGTLITSVPSGLFDNNTLVTTFNRTFRGCVNLTTVPANLFDYNVKVTTFEQCFYNCTSFTSMPSDLFKFNVLATNFNYCFYKVQITSIPSGLFDGCSVVTQLQGTFHTCTSLTSIPSGLFDNNTLMTDFSYCFNGNTSLTSIPSGLFDNCTLVTTFVNCFYNCTSLTGLAPTLWLRSPRPTGTSCFTNDSSLSNYDAIPEDFGGPSVSSSSSSSSSSNSSSSSSSSSIDSSSSSSSSSYDRPFGSGFTTHTNCNGEWFYEGIASGYPFYTKIPGDLSLILVFGTDWSVNSYIIADSPVTYIYQRSPDSTDINGTYNLFGGGAEGTIS